MNAIAERPQQTTDRTPVNRERAAREYATYRFRLSAIAGVPVVYVTSPGQVIYTVHARGERCNCQDFQQRGHAETGYQCKHVLMVRHFLGVELLPGVPAEPDCLQPGETLPTAEDLAREARRAQARKDRDRLFPAD